MVQTRSSTLRKIRVTSFSFLGQLLPAETTFIFIKKDKTFSLQDVREANISSSVIRTEEAVDRKLAICEAVEAVDVKDLTLNNLQITGFRLGVNIDGVENCSVAKSQVF